MIDEILTVISVFVMFIVFCFIPFVQLLVGIPTDDISFIDYGSENEDAVKAIVNKLAEEHNNGWIACSERLPKYLENVLICTETGFVTIAYMQGEIYGNSWADGLGLIREVIAWQPLPAPYMPKGE